MPARITDRGQRSTAFQEAPKLEIRRLCPREVAQGHSPGGLIQLGREGVGAGAEQGGTEGARIVRLGCGLPLAERLSEPT